MTTVIKIISYNIHGARSSFFKRDVTKNIEHILVRSGADVLCLQELWRSGISESNLELACRQAWPYISFGCNVVFPNYNLGNAIFCRFPILVRKNFPLYTKSREPRGLLECEIELPTQKTLTILCTHLGLKTKDRVRELADIVDYCKNKNGPYVLAGDFNDWNQKMTAPLERSLNVREAGLLFKGKHQSTFPALLPFLPLDRLYFKGLKLQHYAVGLERLGPSDHRYIYAEFLAEY